MIRATSWYTPAPRASDTLVRGLCDRSGPLRSGTARTAKVRAGAQGAIFAAGILESAAMPAIADFATG